MMIESRVGFGGGGRQQSMDFSGLAEWEENFFCWMKRHKTPDPRRFTMVSVSCSAKYVLCVIRKSYIYYMHIVHSMDHEYKMFWRKSFFVVHMCVCVCVLWHHFLSFFWGVCGHNTHKNVHTLALFLFFLLYCTPTNYVLLVTFDDHSKNCSLLLLFLVG